MIVDVREIRGVKEKWDSCKDDILVCARELGRAKKMGPLKGRKQSE